MEALYQSAMYMKKLVVSEEYTYISTRETISGYFRQPDVNRLYYTTHFPPTIEWLVCLSITMICQKNKHSNHINRIEMNQMDRDWLIERTIIITLSVCGIDDLERITLIYVTSNIMIQQGKNASYQWTDRAEMTDRKKHKCTCNVRNRKNDMYTDISEKWLQFNKWMSKLVDEKNLWWRNLFYWSVRKSQKTSREEKTSLRLTVKRNDHM